jgi:hypothetical protein
MIESMSLIAVARLEDAPVLRHDGDAEVLRVRLRQLRNVCRDLTVVQITELVVHLVDQPLEFVLAPRIDHHRRSVM